MSETITVDEIKTLIKEEKIKPSRLFGMDVLAKDPVVKGIVKEEVESAVTGEYTHRKRVGDRFDGDKEKWEEEKKQKDEEIKNLKIESATTKAAELFGKKATERKLDDKQTKFIKAKEASFTLEDPENLEKEVDKFMDTALDEYKETAAIFGHKIKEEKEETKEEIKGGGEPVETRSEDENPFIP